MLVWRNFDATTWLICLQGRDRSRYIDYAYEIRQLASLTRKASMEVFLRPMKKRLYRLWI